MAKRSDHDVPWWERFSKRRAKAGSHADVQRSQRKKPPAAGQPAPSRDTPTSAGESAEAAPSGQPSSASLRILEKLNMPALIVAGRHSPHGLQIPVWIYDSTILETHGVPVDGETVAVLSRSGKFLGSAIYNSSSKIRARLFSYERVAFDSDYIERALIGAWNRRRIHFAIEDSFRLAYSEADGLPGLVVDKLGQVVVVQPLTLAIDKRLDVVVQTLRALFAPAGIVIRRDAPVRSKEGLPVLDSEVLGEVPRPLAVELDGVTYFCDPVHGQKTGLYLDQRFNRRLLAPWVSGKRVLDLYCHVGGWSLSAARHGAAQVIGVDAAAPAVELARLAARHGGFASVEFVVADVFDWLSAQDHRKELFDIVICDPPAFAKSHRHLEEAQRAYLSLNYRAMKLVAPGGLLVTCSCSQHLDEQLFSLILETAARNARLRFLRLARGGQPPDHPVLLGFPESDYLKCYLLQRLQ